MGDAFMEHDPKSYIQSLWEESSTQKHKLGTIRRLSDGREFIYGQAGGTNLANAVLTQGVITVVANHGNLAVAANANIGNKTLTVTLGDLAATANMYAEGWVWSSNATTGGQGYKIKSHPAANANASLVLTLYDAIRVANITTAHKATLGRHPGRGLVVHPSPPTAPIFGVAVIPVTANYYAWFQRRGPAICLIEGTMVAGQPVFASNATDGAVGVAVANADDGVTKIPIVGQAMVINATTHYGLIDLKIG